MNKKYRFVLSLILITLLSSCGGSSDNPEISHIIVKSDRLGVLLDTQDKAIIENLQGIFYDKEEKPDAGPEFRYLVDITTPEGTVRWQYSSDGFIRNYEKQASKIFQLKEVAEFNRISKIK